MTMVACAKLSSVESRNSMYAAYVLAKALASPKIVSRVLTAGRRDAHSDRQRSNHWSFYTILRQRRIEGLFDRPLRALAEAEEDKIR